MLQSVGNGFLLALQAFFAMLPGLTRDVSGVAGAGSIAYGAYMLNPAAGFITGGALVLVGVLLASAGQNKAAG